MLETKQEKSSLDIVEAIFFDYLEEESGISRKNEDGTYKNGIDYAIEAGRKIILKNGEYLKYEKNSGEEA